MNIKRPPQEFLGINVIPMIDTMMFLLIFFMMATKFADIERDARVHPPLSHDVRPITEAPRELVVNVTQAGDFLVAGRPLREVAREVLALSRAGLERRGRRDAQGRDEAYFLAVLDEVVASGETAAERMLARYHGEWHDSVAPVFDTFVY